jgi:hypothetical protein
VPNLNEFFNKEEVKPVELEKFGGKKPCSKCDKDARRIFLGCNVSYNELGMS